MSHLLSHEMYLSYVFAAVQCFHVVFVPDVIHVVNSCSLYTLSSILAMHNKPLISQNHCSYWNILLHMQAFCLEAIKYPFCDQPSHKRSTCQAFLCKSNCTSQHCSPHQLSYVTYRHKLLSCTNVTWYINLHCRYCLLFKFTLLTFVRKIKMRVEENNNK